MSSAENLHYHATLMCGHSISFDVAKDLKAEAEAEGAGAYEVLMPCSQCGGTERKSMLIRKMGLATAPCECKGLVPSKLN